MLRQRLPFVACSATCLEITLGSVSLLTLNRGLKKEQAAGGVDRVDQPPRNFHPVLHLLHRWVEVCFWRFLLLCWWAVAFAAVYGVL
jgi:hypothetical protein